MTISITALSDHHALTELVSRIGRMLDDKRFDVDGPALFTADAEISTPGGRARGLEAIVAQARRNHEHLERTQHAVSDVLVALDGDRARVRANVQATLVERADVPETPRMLGAVYHLDAVRTDDGWRCAGMEIAPVWQITP